MVALEGQGQDRLFELLFGIANRPLVNSGWGQVAAFSSPYDAITKGLCSSPVTVCWRFAQLPVRQNLAVPLFNRISRWLSIPGDEPARVDEAIARLSIDTGQPHDGRLSGGNQQGGDWALAGGRLSHYSADPTRGIIRPSVKFMHCCLIGSQRRRYSTPASLPKSHWSATAC